MPVVGGLFVAAAFLSCSLEGTVTCFRERGGSSQAPFPPLGLRPELEVTGAAFPHPPSLRSPGGRRQHGRWCWVLYAVPPCLCPPCTHRTADTSKPEAGKPERVCTVEQPTLSLSIRC